jgi:hypothetical protein
MNNCISLPFKPTRKGVTVMLQRLLGLVAASLFVLSVAGAALAEEVKGKITKVGGEGREITVQTKDGKEVKVSISGSRTTIEGVKGRSDFKEGQSVTVEHEGGDAKNVKVAK